MLEIPALDRASEPRQEPQAETPVGVHASTSSRQMPAAAVAVVLRIMGRIKMEQKVKPLRSDDGRTTNEKNDTSCDVPKDTPKIQTSCDVPKDTPKIQEGYANKIRWIQ